jgi:nucleotide-binding universal stress UspA family protein
MTRSKSRGVVVGVDSSPEAGAALAFAMAEADLRRSVVEIVTAWTRDESGRQRVDDDAAERIRHGAQQIQDSAVARALAAIGVRPVMSRQILEGESGEVLSRAARGAAYLVVGARAKRSSSRIRRGSVGEDCLQHAACPVVVVPL